MKQQGTAKINGKGDYFKAEVIYGYDLDQVLDLLKKTAIQRGRQASHDFYFTCLDRIDILITQKDSGVGKHEVVKILRDLAYFRPRDYHREDKSRRAHGLFTEQELQDDVISVRHKQLIRKNSQRHQTLPGHVFSFLQEHVTKGLFKDMFT